MTTKNISNKKFLKKEASQKSLKKEISDKNLKKVAGGALSKGIIKPPVNLDRTNNLDRMK